MTPGSSAIHHRARSRPIDPSRTAALPAKVHARAGHWPACPRRHWRHLHRSQYRRRPRGELRRLPWPATRIRGIRRRRLHASRQSRRSAPVRSRPAGNAGGRDHHGPARHPRSRPISDARRSRNTVTRSLISKGINYGSIRVASERQCRYFRRSRRRRRLESEVPSSPMAARSRFVNSSSGRSTTRWACKPFDPVLMAANAGQRVVTPSGMVLDGSKDTVRGGLANSANDDPDGDGVCSTRSPRRSSTTWSST